MLVSLTETNKPSAIRRAFWLAYEPMLLLCALIAAGNGLEQSWRYGRLGEIFAGQSYPNCPTIEQLEGEF